MALLWIFSFTIVAIIPSILCDVWCYQCTSTQPGCGDYIDWWIHHSVTCPRSDDMCVKIVERKGAEVTYIRDCLSTIEGKRKDIPADRFEGCRPAATDIRLGQSVENSYLLQWTQPFDDVFYCFCALDYWCNDSTIVKVSFTVLTSGLILTIYSFSQFL